MSGKLSTHVLDIYHGRPAAGLVIELWSCENGQPVKLLKSVVTNVEGRTDGPLLSGDEFSNGTYELRFKVDVYFQRTSGPLPQPAFLGEVPVRFGVADASANYHVPLLVSPWAYSTYRGS